MAAEAAEISSEFEFEAEAEEGRKRGARSEASSSRANQGHFLQQHSRASGAAVRQQLLSLDAYSRHKRLVNEYLLSRPGAAAQLRRDCSGDRTDLDVIRQQHRFLWDDGCQPEPAVCSWEQRLSRRYYDKLFKEYCIADLSRYRSNRIALRWRVAREVVEGKGQFVCGNKRCMESAELSSWEVNFAYVEHGQRRNALVKLRLCPPCSVKLNYRQRRSKAKRFGHAEAATSAAAKPAGGVQPSREAEGGAAAAVQQLTAEQQKIWMQAAPEAEAERSQEQQMDEFLGQLLL